MENIITVKNEDGSNINISVLGYFSIKELDKEYIMYSMQDDNENNSYGAVIIGEVIKEDNIPVQVLGIREEEKEMVIAYYNEISEQLGGE